MQISVAWANLPPTCDVAASVEICSDTCTAPKTWPARVQTKLTSPFLDVILPESLQKFYTSLSKTCVHILSREAAWQLEDIATNKNAQPLKNQQKLFNFTELSSVQFRKGKNEIITQLLQSFTKLSSSLQIDDPDLGKPIAALSMAGQGDQILEGSVSKGASVCATIDLEMGPNSF